MFSSNTKYERALLNEEKRVLDNAQKKRNQARELSEKQFFFISDAKPIVTTEELSNATILAILAAAQNNIPELDEAIKAGAALNYMRSETQSNLLQFAAENGAVATTKHLISKYDFNPAWRSNKEVIGYNFLHCFCANGNSQIVYALLDNFYHLLNVNDVTLSHGLTALQLATTNFHVELAENLIKKYNADLSICDFLGRSILTLALGMFNTTKYSEFLDENKNTPENIKAVETFYLKLLTEYHLNAFECTGDTSMTPIDVFLSYNYGLSLAKQSSNIDTGMSTNETSVALTEVFKRFIQYNPNLARELKRQANEMIEENTNAAACEKARTYIGKYDACELECAIGKVAKK